MQRNSFSLNSSYKDKLFEVNNQPLSDNEGLPGLPFWKKIFKRLLDIVVSITGLILFLPLMIYVAIKIKLDSVGSIFYLQERIGCNDVPFTIFKFRSMYQDSERHGPALCCNNDKRVTKWGETIRKWKLDELPQLVNILIGDMSLVGPRPERKFYIDKVSVTYPYFTYLHRVKPGLTSLGMIKFGYAQNIEEIIQRMTYDINYMERYSLLLDFKIIYYTLRSIIDGRIFNSPINLRIRLPHTKISTLN